MTQTTADGNAAGPDGTPAVVVSPYRAADFEAWNALVAASPNGSFLFDRRYMEYHADRFEDASCLLHAGSQFVGLLPAHRSGQRLVSHGGLSYGGLVLADGVGAVTVLRMMQALQAHARALGLDSIVYKTVPPIYHRRPCEADRYALFRCGAQLMRRDALSVIAPHGASARKRAITQAARRRPELSFDVHRGAHAAWGQAWAVLEAELQRRHGVRPVHSLAEIEQLATLFPDHIALHVARWNGDAVAALVLYENDTVCHVQYMAANDQARRCAALDLLLERAIDAARQAGRWFDFGHSNEDDGRVMNEGLAHYKESFGAGVVVHDHYLLPC